jgi:hypothetical protein
VKSDLGAPPLLAEVPVPPHIGKKSRNRMALLLKWPVGFLKFFIGMILCQMFLGSILIVGWTYRMMQRVVYKRWWSQSPLRRSGLVFREYLEQSPETRVHLHWPNWVFQQNFLKAVRKRPIKALVQSLWLNFKIGFGGIFNTWVLTLPGCVLMLFSWYDGWNNSFNKGYEQAPVGPLTGILGIILFILAMLYVPMAQARQAATGNWRSFYEFRLIRRLVLRRWPACLGLAVLYALMSLLILYLRVLPQYFPQMGHQSVEALAALPKAQLRDNLNGYFFWCAIVVLPAFVVLRILAARIYATGLLSGVEHGAIPVEWLASSERTELDRLNLLQVQSAPKRHVLLRMVDDTVNWLFWGIATVCMFLIWFAFVAQIYVAQFLNYIPGIGWLNQPLVQLPIFHFIPAGLR